MRKLPGLLVLAVCVTPASADVQDLIKKLSAPDNEVRRAAAKDLGEMGKDAKPAIPALTKALKDPDRFVRRWSAEALGKIGPDARGTIPALSALLQDNQAVREAAIKALGKMGGDAIPALTKALSGTTSDVQEHAIAALAEAGPSAVPALTGAIKDSKMAPALRRKAVEGVVKQGKAGRDAIGALAGVVKDGKVGGGREGVQLRVDSANALARLATKDDSTAVSALDEVAKKDKENNQVKNAARRALAAIQKK